MIGDEYTGLKTCGPAPNCFCSTDNLEDDPDHVIPAWKWPATIDQRQAFQQLQQVIAAYQPGQDNIDGGGFKIITFDVDPSKGYIYAQFESLKAGYIDDLEFAFIQGLGTSGSGNGNGNGNGNDVSDGDGSDTYVQVRSSSRIGYLDFGVNAKRLNYIAKVLSEKGWNAPGVEYKTHKGYFIENQVSG